MGDLLGSLAGLFGKDSSLMKILGSEGMKNLISGGTSLYQASQTGDMLDFQKGLANKAEGRTQKLFDQDQDEQEALNNLNFG